MTVGVRLALGFALVIAMLVASMAMSINRLQSLGSSVEEFAQSRVPKLALSGKVVETLLQSARQMRNVLILDAEAQIKRDIADVERNDGVVKDMLDQVEKLVASDTERSLFQSISAARTAYDPWRKFLDLAKGTIRPPARDARRAGDAQDKAHGAASTFIEYQVPRARPVAQAREPAPRANHPVGAPLIAAAIGVAAADHPLHH